ncbi:TPA: hypothetical protein ACH3X1_015629 [Trebouxia sp. C0004]
MDAKPSLLAPTPVARCTSVPMQKADHMVTLSQNSQQLPSCSFGVTEYEAICMHRKINSFGWLRDSGFVRHKEPHLDAPGALADLLAFSLNLTGLGILAKIESQDMAWGLTNTWDCRRPAALLHVAVPVYLTSSSWPDA